MVTLVTGGVKSGKSAYALRLARTEFRNPAFLATAVPFDEEMREKIRRHQAERGNAFSLVEEPIEIHRALRDEMVLDCVPLWLNNLFYHNIQHRASEILEGLIQALPQNLIIVTNETGMGTISLDPLTRSYNDLLGRVNQRLAAVADRVILMVCGIPLTLKGPRGGTDRGAPSP